MEPLNAMQFGEFYRAVHGDDHEPFHWQKRLAEEVLRNGFHDVIRVPTGCGKTSVLDLALFELALQAELQTEKRTAARRICFVVDRRLVVDEVSDHAARIEVAVRGAAHGSREEPVLRAVAQRLVSLAADADEPLRVVRLRGGVYRDDGWSADPLTPTILVSTVDQIGSRLLFRGYGVGPRSRPLQAGLLAFDTRIILDEAHLSTVFASTVERVRQYQQWADRPPLDERHRVSVVRMSATAGETTRTFDFGKESKDWEDERLSPRLEAHKLAVLTPIEVEALNNQMREKQPLKAREQEKRNRAEMVQGLAASAKTAAGFRRGEGQQQDCPGVIAVVVNRVATARNVFDLLRQVRQGEPERDAILLTGRIRPYDRDRLLDQWLPKMKAGRIVAHTRPLFVVATQTVEVGANLDFDALVTEAAPLDALRQRFGRLDRLGKRHQRGAPSPAAILIRSDQKSKSDDDRVYGSAIAETWKWLSSPGIAASSGKGKAKQMEVDFGIKHLHSKLAIKADTAVKLVAGQRDAPMLFPAHLDAWVQTDPLPEPEPDVAPFLHGRADAPADVQVVWRADLNDDDAESWARIVSLMPPRTREALPVPIYEVQAWLIGQAEAEITDVEGVPGEFRSRDWQQSRQVLRWCGPDDAKPVGPTDLRPGDTIVVPANYGGADKYGWNPNARQSVDDVAEACLAEVIASYPVNAFRRPKLRLRLHAELFPKVDDQAHRRFRRLLDSVAHAATADVDESWPTIRTLLGMLRGHVTATSHLAAVDAFLDAKRAPRIEIYPRAAGIVVSAALLISLKVERDVREAELETEEPDDDEASFATGGREVLLSEHRQSVSDMASRFAEYSGLHVFVDPVRTAGRWHDEGKRDYRCQAWLHGSELAALTALSADRPLAKSGRDPRKWGRSEVFGYPSGARHEFVSVRLFEQTAQETENSELAKFLIGTHHGRGRPFPPVLIDRKPVKVRLSHDGKEVTTSSDHQLYRLQSGWVDLFWRMVRRYGWWGMAYLEAMLVTADRSVSTREQRVRQLKPLPRRSQDEHA